MDWHLQLGLVIGLHQWWVVPWDGVVGWWSIGFRLGPLGVHGSNLDRLREQRCCVRGVVVRLEWADDNKVLDAEVSDLRCRPEVFGETDLAFEAASMRFLRRVRRCPPDGGSDVFHGLVPGHFLLRRRCSAREPKPSPEFDGHSVRRCKDIKDLGVPTLKCHEAGQYTPSCEA
jgi:hypothetical protein